VDGFAHDASHRPNITTLQRDVRTAAVVRVVEVVAATIARTDIALRPLAGLL